MVTLVGVTTCVAFEDAYVLPRPKFCIKSGFVGWERCVSGRKIVAWRVSAEGRMAVGAGWVVEHAYTVFA